MVLRLEESLRRLGHEVVGEPLTGPGGPMRYVLSRKRVAALIRNFRPDIVHSHFGYSGLAVPRGSPPWVATFNGDDLNGTTSARGGVLLKSRLGILVSQFVAWRSTRCIAVSADLRQRLWFPTARRKTTVIRDSVDPKLFRPMDRTVARRRLALGSDSVIVLFPHDVTQPNKRLSLAQEAVEVLRQWVPVAHLLVVNNCAPNEMPWYYAAADAMIITSVREGGPSSAKEALACGLPVVSVDVGDRELFREVPQAMLRAAAKPADLAQALRQVTQTGQRARKSLLPPSLELEAGLHAVLEVYQLALAGANALPRT